jgi:ubiquinone/menaquinone biosynthesis C-methylase UbiE
MSDVLAANIEVHTRMAERYETNEPHFRPENKEKVKGRLKVLRARTPGGRLLDIGCGTGFIIHLAVDIFDEIHGVDITPAMMKKVRAELGNITLHEAKAEQLPFAGSSFDAVSAYSFIDHVADPRAVLREVARVLKPGGVFYIDLAPNRSYWQALISISDLDRKVLSDIVSREVSMVTENDKRVEREFDIPTGLFVACEPAKKHGGIDPAEFQDSALSCGFKTCEVFLDWFLGQGAVSHGQSFDDAAVIEGYLRRAAPVTDHLFKYFHCLAVK